MFLQGSAFYALQSCVNHDNAPNCTCQKDIDDRDGAAVLTALRTISPGEELTISYVGDVSLYSPADLASTLAEYGIPT
jgi:SET domain-containing protein